MSQQDWVSTLTDEELRIVAQELHARAEEFDARTRLIINDELRRRRMPTVPVGRSRH